VQHIEDYLEKEKVAALLEHVQMLLVYHGDAITPHAITPLIKGHSRSPRVPLQPVCGRTCG